eukprot:TRINITY_DN7418_c1_g3_i1.p1 TRINITY_DN7418_c1_g3~~TRINITY_DN7418_c1_g3_i1.p1  ORF type:complete len:380 (-),score=68.13 TRINITY_DN7418_c1_g3_i1:28-1167(-)
MGRGNAQFAIDVHDFVKLENAECPGSIPTVNDVMRYLQSKNINADKLKDGAHVTVRSIQMPLGVQMVVFRSTGERWDYNMEHRGERVKIIAANTRARLSDGDGVAFKLEFLADIKKVSVQGKRGTTNRCIVSVPSHSWDAVVTRANDLGDSFAASQADATDARAGWAMQYARNVCDFGRHCHFWVVIIAGELEAAQRDQAKALTEVLTHMHHDAHELVYMKAADYLQGSVAKWPSSNYCVTFHGRDNTSYTLDVTKFAKLENSECRGTIPSVNDIMKEVKSGGTGLKSGSCVTVSKIAAPMGVRVHVFRSAGGAFDYDMESAAQFVGTVDSNAAEHFRDGDAAAYRLEFLSDPGGEDRRASKGSQLSARGGKKEDCVLS